MTRQTNHGKVMAWLLKVFDDSGGGNVD
jgi:hypothetical protein